MSLLHEVADNPGLMRHLTRVCSYTLIRCCDRYDGVPMSGMLESGDAQKYWFICVNIQDNRRIALTECAWVYALVKLSDEEMEEEDKKQEEWEKAEKSKNENVFKQFYDKYPPSHDLEYKDHEVVAWYTSPPDHEVVLMRNDCKCSVELGVHHALCERCDGNWKQCDKMKDHDYLMKFDKEELVEIIEELSSRG